MKNWFSRKVCDEVAASEAPPADEVEAEVEVVDAAPVAPSPASTPALPEAPLPAVAKPLTAGAFLGGEYEVKELLARGPINWYRARVADYGSTANWLALERAVSPDTDVAQLSLPARLFLPGHFFRQENCEYFAFEEEVFAPLEDYREPTNDLRYLEMMSTLVDGLQELEERGLTMALATENLFVNAAGNLKYLGFFDALSPAAGPQSTPVMESLRTVSRFLLRQVFAEAATMRLEDEWSGLALTEETKVFARALADEYSSLAEVAVALNCFPKGEITAISALLSDVGMEREINEDSGMILRLQRAGHVQQFDVELFAVADGMGGHEGGEIASFCTLNALEAALLARRELNWNDNVVVRAAMWEIIDEVNAAVVQLTEEPRYRALTAKPGATLTFALRVGARLFIGNVGDSRTYLWNPAGLERVSKDHSYVQTLLDSGQITEEEAWEHPDGSIITSHIGISKLKLRDVFLRLAKAGDKLLLVSDGVVDMLRDSDIEPLLHQENPALVCESLVTASNVAGGHDNITALCVCFQ